MVGEWTYVDKFWMSPNTPPSMSTGTTTTKAIMGGRYFISEHKGVMSMPGPDGKLMNLNFDGMEMDGYDNMQQKFVSTWLDNFGTGIMHFEGTYNPTAKSITYVSEEEMMPGVKTKVREVVILTDPDHRHMEYFEDQGGHEMEAMEVSYTRATHSP